MLKSNVIRFTFGGDYYRDTLQAREPARGPLRRDEYMNKAKGPCINSHLL